MAGRVTIQISAGLARENGALRKVQEGGHVYYVAEVKVDEEVIEARLVPVETPPGEIRRFLTEWGQYHYRIAEVMKNSIFARM